MEQYEKDRTSYENNYKLVNCLKYLNMPEETELIREEMHKLYPLTESMWLDWIKDAKRDAKDTDGIHKVLSLYERASADYLSIAIWKSFVEYTVELFDNQWENMDRVNVTRANLKKAVTATKWHMAQSHEIWNSYIEFQVNWLEHLESPTPEQIQQVMKDYIERLATLHTDHENTFSQYSTFNTKWDNDNYEKNMVKANQVYAKTKKAMNELEQYELRLAESGYSLDMFYQYIETMKLKDKAFLNYTQNLYERAVALYCTDVALWDDYIVFLLDRARIPVVLETVTKRAIRNCPWSGVLIGHHVRSLEARDANPLDILRVFDAAKTNETLMSSQEDYIALYLAKSDYFRRRVGMENHGLDSDDITRDPLSELRLTLMEGITNQEKSFKSMDPYFRLERYYSFVEVKCTTHGNYDNVRQYWEKVVKKFGKSVEAWLGYIQFERSIEDFAKCKSLFKRAIAKQPDDPDRLMHAWLSMEHEMGSLDSLQDAFVRINKKTKQLVQEWQAATVMEETKQVQEYEKTVREKQKKAQHRQKLKQNKKQARMEWTASQTPAKRKADEMNEDTAIENDHPPADTHVDDTTEPTAPATTESSHVDDTITATATKSSHVDDTTTTTAIESSRVDDTITATTTESSHVDENNNVTAPSSPQSKRRRIESNDNETTSNQSAPRDGRGRGRGRGHKGPGRYLGRGIGRAGRLAMPSTRPTSQNQDEATTTTAGSTAPEETTKPKSQDDFRAMLLGKK